VQWDCPFADIELNMAFVLSVSPATGLGFHRARRCRACSAITERAFPGSQVSEQQYDMLKRRCWFTHNLGTAYISTPHRGGTVSAARGMQL